MGARALLGRKTVTVKAVGGYIEIRQDAHGAGSDEIVTIEPEDVPRLVKWLGEVATEIQSPPPQGPEAVR